MTRMFMKSKILLTIKILIIFILISFNLKNIAMASTFSEEQIIKITKNLENGKTNEEIFSSLVEKYGQWIVYDPGISRNTLLLWTLPLLLFLIGGAIIAKKIYRKI
jgi:cytochrome c-type biogenesis protein CcmH/NrfF